MALAKDKVQISISFITDESKEYAALINQNKQFIKELKDAQKAGKDVTDQINKMVESGKSVEKLDLSKIAPAQLRDRARQIQQVIALIPQSAPQYRALNAELAAINGQLGAIRASQNGAGQAAQSFFQRASAGARGLVAAMGPIAVAIIGIQSAWDGVKALFNIGQDAEALQTKMTAVFGESTKVVNDFAAQNAAAIGLSRREYAGLATDVGDLLTPMGFTKQTAAELSVELVNQAGILSRWTKGKVDTKTATEILNKALLGERDALNSLGIDIKDSLIQAELKKKGLDKLTGAELRQAEALVTLEQITQQSSNANASFAKATEDLQEKKARLRARIMEIVDAGGKSLIPMFNRVLGVIIPVVEWVVNFGTRLAEVWQKAETFRAVLTSAFSGVYGAIAGVVKGLGSIADGFVELFSGNFSAAAAKFGEGLDNAINPVRIGINLAEGVKEGWNSVKNPQAEVAPGDPAAAAGEGRKLGSAFGGAYDKEFAKIKANSKKSAEQLAKDQKEAIDNGLKEVEAARLRKEILLEAERLAGTVSEREYGNQLVAIQKAALDESIAVYRRYAQEQSNEALKLKNELAKLNAETARSPVAEAPLLGTRRAGPVTSLTEGDNTDGRLAALAQSQKLIQDKLAETVRIEEELDLRRLEAKRNFIAEEIRILRDSANPQTDIIRKREEDKAKIEEDIAQQRIVAQQKFEEIQQQTLQIGFDTASDVFKGFEEILSRDEASKKKHAETIKTLQKGQIQLNLIAELSGIFANAQESPVAKLLGPVAGNVLAGVQAGIATARAFVAMNKVDAQKFERGRLVDFWGRSAKMGLFGGRPHSQGGTKLYGDDGTVIEVERGELFAVVNRKNAPLIRNLSALNAHGGNGDAYMERGGLMSFNTTPNAAATAAAGQDNAYNALVQEFAQFRNDVGTWATSLRVVQVYSDLEYTSKVVTNIASEAAL